MRSKFYFAVAAILVLAMVPITQAQDPNDVGIPDTIRFECPTFVNPIVPGDSFQVGIYIWNDEDIGGFTIPIVYSSDYVEVSSMDTTGGVFSFYQWAAGAKWDSIPDANRWLFGWFAADPTNPLTPPIPPDTLPGGELSDKARFVAAFNFRVLEGATPEVINIDTIFFPPAGYWAMSIDRTPGGAPYNIVNIEPIYKDCGLGDIFLPVEEVDGPNLPTSYSLSQNVPNPFNPNTTIEFALPRTSEVNLDVFNLLGQKVRTLVNDQLRAGFQRVEWDGKDDNGAEVASGVYLYRIKAGTFVESKKMMLLK